MIDVFGAIVGVESPDLDGIILKQLHQGWHQIPLADFLHAAGHFELDDLGDGIDVVDPLYLVLVTLMYCVYADKTRLSFMSGLAPLAYSGCLRLGLL